MNDYEDWDDLEDSARMRLVGLLVVGFLVITGLFGWALFEYAPGWADAIGSLLMGA